ncbi:hypothetical protein H5410_003286, partial [Solanum commersonii]
MPEYRLIHLASRQKALTSPKVPQKLKGDKADQRVDPRVHRRSRLTAPRKAWTPLGNRNKTSKKTKKRRPEDHLMHSVSRRKALTSPKVPRIFYLAFEDLKFSNSKKLEMGLVVIGSSWFLLERVNPRPSPTLSARESEWAKAEVVLKSGNSVFERNRVYS